MLLNLACRDVAFDVNRREFAPCCHHALNEVMHVRFCHLLSDEGVIKEIDSCKVSYLIFAAIVPYVFEITASKYIMVVTAVNHTSTLTFAQQQI